MIKASAIADDVRRFVLTSIPSIPYLEAMLLLRNEEGKGWDHRILAQRLYLSEKTAAGLLAELHEAGILRTEGQDPVLYFYAPDSDSLRTIIDRVAATYSTHLVEITNLIHSTSARKAQQFADAFKWRKDS
ncbi:hypothetical protein [Noviherbaspirillum aerium]|uniref:hypothetical protein n=1 Tax=Noviherbaspirillum aerium TaxID=2588497 RepID=UPI00124BEB05|nr:hypothetical protein [Noviherbaspirillum aerium]